jgi:hypothetical protein
MDMYLRTSCSTQDILQLSAYWLLLRSSQNVVGTKPPPLPPAPPNLGLLPRHEVTQGNILGFDGGGGPLLRWRWLACGWWWVFRSVTAYRRRGGETWKPVTADVAGGGLAFGCGGAQGVCGVFEQRDLRLVYPVATLAGMGW